MTLVLRNLTLVVPDGRETLTILDDVSLRLRAGETTVLTGRSGSGKSTLLAVAGLLRTPDSGTVEVAGTKTSGLKKSELTRLRREHIGIIYQGSNLFPALTARQQVELVAHIRGKLDRAARARARELLVTVGLEDRLDTRPAQLSGGERQRVGIARALMNEPSVLLADEPTASLDVERGEAVMVLLQEQTKERGISTLIVTHASDQIRGADVRVQIDTGRLDGPVRSGDHAQG